MDLEITVSDRVYVFQMFEEGITQIVDILKAWNNFEDTTIPMTITVRKVQATGPPALGIDVKEEVDTSDLFGRR